MFKISHRGNINGPDPRYENNPSYILEAIDASYNVEVDVWAINGKLFLGHNNPEYKINLQFLKKNEIWCHCKNIESLTYLLQENIHCFIHNTDEATITSKGYIWTYPGKMLTNKSICVLPERDNWNVPETVSGVCSDYIGII